MIPLLFILPVLWAIAYKQGKDATLRRGSGFLAGIVSRRPLTAADYLRHLNEAAAAAAAVDSVKLAASRADMNALLQAPEEVGHAVVVLRAPLEILFLQKDLNVLGVEPPLPEDGKLGPDTRDAVAALQARFGQIQTGRPDPDTAAAIRYAVGCIYSQDRAFVV